VQVSTAYFASSRVRARSYTTSEPVMRGCTISRWPLDKRNTACFARADHFLDRVAPQRAEQTRLRHPAQHVRLREAGARDREARSPGWPTRCGRGPLVASTDACELITFSGKTYRRDSPVLERGGAERGDDRPQRPRLDGFTIRRARLAKTDVLRRVSKPRLLRTLRATRSRK